MARFAFPFVALVACALVACALVGCGDSPSPSPGPSQVGATAVLNIIRHGEKCEADDKNGLSPEGRARAAYLTQCMSSSTVSRAMPYGKATAVMASKNEEGKTTRPVDTVTPLAEALGLQVQTPCLKKDSGCFATEVHKMLSNRSTVVAAWTNEQIPDIFQAVMNANSKLNTALGVGVGHDWSTWQSECPSEDWDEPTCASEGKACYDEIWQVTFNGTESGGWMASSSSIFREGFAGFRDERCFADLTADQGFIAPGGSCQMTANRDLCGPGLECKRRPHKTGNRICVQNASETIVV